MLKNRSIPNSAVIPPIPYANVTKAAEWLRDAFRSCVPHDNRRIQMNVGDGAIVFMEPRGNSEPRVIDKRIR